MLTEGTDACKRRSTSKGWGASDCLAAVTRHTVESTTRRRTVVVLIGA